MASVETRTSGITGLASHRVRWRADGKNHAETFATRGQAEKWKALLDVVGPAKALEALAVPAAAQSRTVAEQVAHHIDHLTGVEPGTVRDYRKYLDVDIAPVLGAIPLQMLDEDDVKRWVNHLDVKRGLSRKSIMNRHSLLSASLSTAIRGKLIAYNPAEGVRMPTRDHEAEEMVTLSLAEVWRFIDCAKHDWHRPLLTWLFGTGARFGESTALKVGAVDVDAHIARIREAWKHTDGDGHRLGTPKSQRSIRTVVYGQAVADAIRPLVEGRPAGAFVFTNTRGGPVRRSNFHEDVWLPALRKFAGDTVEKVPTAGRPRLVWTEGPGKRPRPHDARHTYASLQIARGASMAYLQKQLGHESITTTINTYTHLQTADLAVLGDVIDQPAPLELGVAAIEG